MLRCLILIQAMVAIECASLKQCDVQAGIASEMHSVRRKVGSGVDGVVSRQHYMQNMENPNVLTTVDDHREHLGQCVINSYSATIIPFGW